MHALTAVDGDEIAGLLAADEFFWLDLTAPSVADVATVERLLPVVDARPIESGDRVRPRLDREDNHISMVFFGARRRADRDVDLLPTRVFISGAWVVSSHADAIPELDEARARMAHAPDPSEEAVVHRVVDSLVDTFATILAEVDDEIDVLESAVISGPTNEQLKRISHLKRMLVVLRRTLAPQRDLFARAGDEIAELPGLEPSKYHDLRALYDRLSRLSELIDAYRDLLTGVMDVYLSTVSNRLNVVMKRLTVVATIFLPLTLVTGFFGMNFGWMARQIATPAAFFLLGVGGTLVSGLAIWMWIRRTAQ